MVSHVLARIFMLAWTAPLTLGLLATYPLPFAPIAAAVLALTFPAFTLRRLLAPLGLPRVAYVFARVSPPLAASVEVRGGAVFFAALALLHARRSEPATMAWLETRLVEAVHLRGMSLAAAGLLAAARGKRETARSLLAAVDGPHGRPAARVARRAARTWLITDAARRGDWGAVLTLGRRSGFAMRWPSLMGAIAARILGDPRAPSDWRLRLAWFVTPHRRATWPMVRRALSVPRGAESAAPEPTDTEGALDAALHAHAACLRAPSSTALSAAARAWDAARASTALTERWLETVEDDLSHHAWLAAEGATATSPTLTAAARRARRRELDALAFDVRDLERRMAEKLRLHVLEEWMAWSTLRRRCERALRGADPSERRGVFVTVYSGACNYAVWLFNGRGEKLLANRIFRWLLEIGEGVADPSAVTLLKKNIASGDGS